MLYCRRQNRHEPCAAAERRRRSSEPIESFAVLAVVYIEDAYISSANYSTYRTRTQLSSKFIQRTKERKKDSPVQRRFLSNGQTDRFTACYPSNVYSTLIKQGIRRPRRPEPPCSNHLGSAKQPTREQTLAIHHGLEKAQRCQTSDLPYSQLRVGNPCAVRRQGSVSKRSPLRRKEGMWGFCWAVGWEDGVRFRDGYG